MRFVLSILLSCFLTAAYAQQQSMIGQWQEQLPYSRAIAVEKAEDKVYCATKSGLFEYEPSSFLIKKWSKVNGLSDVEIQTLKYSKEHKILILAYANSNIDLIRDGQIINIPDIKRKQITGSKRINSILIYEDQAFLSCGFGIISLNLVRGEITSTFHIGKDGEHVEVFETEIFNYDSIFAATSKGVRKAYINHPNLENYIFWEDVKGLPYPDGAYTHLAYDDGILYASHKANIGDLDSLFTYNGYRWEPFPYVLEDIRQMNIYQSKLVIVSDFQVNIINQNSQREQHINTYGFDVVNAYDAYLDEEAVLWVADWNYGLLRSNDFENYDPIRPNGPNDRNAFDLAVADNELWIAGGGYDGAWNNTWTNSGLSYNNSGQWIHLNSNTVETMGDVRDITRVVVDPTNSKHVFAGSWGYGVMEFLNGEFQTLYNDENTNGALQSIFPGSPYIRIGGLAFDSQNNLWVTNSSVPNPLSVRKPDGTWKNFPYGLLMGDAFTGRIVITPGDIKWIQLPKGFGLFAVDHNGTLDDQSDDQFTKVTVRALWPQGNIKVLNDIYSMAVDLDGRLWIGTSNGVTVYYAPSRVFGPYEFYSNQPSVNLGDSLYHPLLGTETVTAIAVDGANRKWFGTRNSGVFLTNPDGTELVRSFNTLNSPLLSDNILSLTIDQKTGEIYFGTEAGVVSYRGDAIRDDQYQGEVYAFPNPVRPEYTGPITIRGLAYESIVKITDVAGNLVYQTESQGGQAIWNGTNMNGERVSTGVYIVFSSTADAQVKSVAKILFIR